MDRIFNDLQYDKIELENKFICLNDKINYVQKDINEFNANIEDIGVTKLKVVFYLLLFNF